MVQAPPRVGKIGKSVTNIRKAHLKTIPIILLSLLCSASIAQTLTGFKLDAPQVVVGQPVKATIDFEVTNNVFCGVRIDWGDGIGDELKINKPAKIPYLISHAYSKPGDYLVTVKPEKVTSHLRCLGKDLSTRLLVVAAAAPAALLAKPMTVTNSCPTGWNLDTKSVNKKSQEFICSAKVGTALPDKKLVCAGDTGYFENAKKGVLGCRL